MKITNVTPGLLPIPPNGWGAVEKIIWEVHNNLTQIGHISDIKYLNDVTPQQTDIVHIHVANLALEAHSRGIPYYFSMHDHHSVLYGKDSHVFKENYEAIKNSILTFLPAKYLVDYFGLPNAIYLPHGVNTEYFQPKSQWDEHSILCVANNGYANNPTYDRKGFLPAIEVARELGLPITIAGPTKNNREFFQTNPVDYPKLSIKYDLSEEELRSEMKNHTIFLHLSELEAGHPNLTLLEAMASGLVVVGTLEDGVDIDGLCKVKRDVSDAVSKVKWVLDNYEDVRKQSLQTVSKFHWKMITKELVNHYKFSKETIKHKFINTYKEAPLLKIPSRKVGNKIIYSFLEGPKVEILGSDNQSYTLKFIDLDKNSVVYESSIGNNQWAKANRQYFTNWKLEVHSNGQMIDSHTFDCRGKHVFIKFDSSSLGDTLAWIPYVDEFRKKHNCKVSCFTFMNDLFRSEYPEINWVGQDFHSSDLYTSYLIGWFYNSDGDIDFTRNPSDFRTQPLQKTASDVLGISFSEIQPKLKKVSTNETLPEKYFTFSIQSTAQSKYWNFDGGWETLLELLSKNGYVGVCIDKYAEFGIGGNMNKIPKNCIDLTGIDLTRTISVLSNSQFHIGLSSGLAWLAWAVDTKVVLISGFTDPICEFTKNCIRIHNDNVCNGCFTNKQFKFDPSDWMWCPVHKGTDRQFECTKSITPTIVFEKMKQGGVV
jgi:autotransporter strand-loop-strand O-heptosyltransferase